MNLDKEGEGGEKGCVRWGWVMAYRRKEGTGWEAVDAV